MQLMLQTGNTMLKEIGKFPVQYFLHFYQKQKKNQYEKKSKASDVLSWDTSNTYDLMRPTCMDTHSSSL